MKIHPLTPADLANISARLSRLPDPTEPAAIARRLMRLGYKVTAELVEVVAAHNHGERFLDPEPEPEATKAPRGRKPPKGGS